MIRTSCFSAGKYFKEIHIRKGPNKVGFVGIFQPFRDAIKLFTREQYFPLVSNYSIYYFSPIFGFFTFFASLVVDPLFEWFCFL